jgi:hypothetical protein
MILFHDDPVRAVPFATQDRFADEVVLELEMSLHTNPLACIHAVVTGASAPLYGPKQLTASSCQRAATVAKQVLRSFRVTVSHLRFCSHNSQLHVCTILLQSGTPNFRSIASQASIKLTLPLQEVEIVFWYSSPTQLAKNALASLTSCSLRVPTNIPTNMSNK